ncbi:MAG: hypothetical protein JSU66_04650, partial [Deltaproteobacteria bacterium]
MRGNPSSWLAGASVLALCWTPPAASAEPDGRSSLHPCQLEAPGTPRRVSARCARVGVPEDH